MDAWRHHECAWPELVSTLPAACGLRYDKQSKDRNDIARQVQQAILIPAWQPMQMLHQRYVNTDVQQRWKHCMQREQ